MTGCLQVIPIDPALHLKEAMQAANFVLKNNKIMCIFPEGERSIDENVKTFKKGVGILAKELDVKLVPAYIKNSHFSWPRGRKFPQICKLEVIFGPAKTCKELIKIASGDNLDEYSQVAQGLRLEVLKLKTPD